VKFYSVEETATMLGVTPRTLYNWKNHSGQNNAKHIPVLHSVTAPNGRKYFREEEILKALSECWEIKVSSETLVVPNLAHA
jgi:hypothetical protein